MNALIRVVRRATRVSGSVRGYASQSEKTGCPDELVVVANRDMIICWHPERAFPYEHSLPLPEEQPENPDLVLSVAEKDVQKVFHKKKDSNLLAQELARMTYTTKHRWFPRSRDRKAKTTPPNRPYL